MCNYNAQFRKRKELVTFSLPVHAGEFFFGSIVYDNMKRLICLDTLFNPLSEYFILSGRFA